MAWFIPLCEHVARPRPYRAVGGTGHVQPAAQSVLEDRRRHRHSGGRAAPRRSPPAASSRPSTHEQFASARGLVEAVGRSTTTTTCCSRSTRCAWSPRAAGSSSTPASVSGRSPACYAALSNDGSFLTALADAGFARETVDTVICTHMHFDHVGLEHDPRRREVGADVPERALSARAARVRALDRRHRRRSGSRRRPSRSTTRSCHCSTPASSISSRSTTRSPATWRSSTRPATRRGTCRCASARRVRSRSSPATACTTRCSSPSPSWHLVVDTDGDQSTATRQRLVAECCDQPVLVIGTHFPPPTAGHVVSTPDGGTRFQPLA